MGGGCFQAAGAWGVAWGCAWLGLRVAGERLQLHFCSCHVSALLHTTNYARNAPGFALHATYRRQFVKVLRLVYNSWLPDLGSHDDDAAAVATRLKTYLDDRLFEKPPEGLAIKKTDISSWWGQREETGGGGGRW